MTGKPGCLRYSRRNLRVWSFRSIRPDQVLRVKVRHPQPFKHDVARGRRETGYYPTPCWRCGRETDGAWIWGGSDRVSPLCSDCPPPEHPRPAQPRRVMFSDELWSTWWDLGMEITRQHRGRETFNNDHWSEESGAIGMIGELAVGAWMGRSRAELHAHALSQLELAKRGEVVRGWDWEGPGFSVEVKSTSKAGDPKLSVRETQARPSPGEDVRYVCAAVHRPRRLVELIGWAPPEVVYAREPEAVQSVTASKRAYVVLARELLPMDWQGKEVVYVDS